MHLSDMKNILHISKVRKWTDFLTSGIDEAVDFAALCG